MKGWHHLQCYCENAEDILGYGDLSLFSSSKSSKQDAITENFDVVKEAIKIENIKQLGKKFVAKFSGITSPEQASTWSNLFLGVSRERLSPPPQGNYYWHDLIGARVVSLYMGREIMLGTITSMQRCPANDNMVILGEEGKYSYIPFICPQYVTEVQLEPQGAEVTPLVKVNWDPDF